MIEDLKATARRTWEEIFPACDVEALAEVIAPDSIEHGARPDEPQGFEGAMRTMLWLGQVFSDQRWEIHKLIGEGTQSSSTARTTAGTRATSWASRRPAAR
jgi:hypothetical protein